MKTLIAPSILASDFLHLADQIAEVEKAGADWLHLDIMDGHFVPNITFGSPVVQAIRKFCTIPLDAHLMIENPEVHIQAFRESGADIITIHQETCMQIQRVIAQIKESGAKAGVAINPDTPISTLQDILHDIDLVLIMTVKAGYGGQPFIPKIVNKIEECSSFIKKIGRAIYLEVDGGIDKTTASIVKRAGANVLVAGTSIFHSNSISQAIQDLRS